MYIGRQTQVVVASRDTGARQHNGARRQGTSDAEGGSKNDTRIIYVEIQSGARKIVEAIMEAVDSLEETPFIGRPGRWVDTRELVVAKYPYIVAYRIAKTVVEILYIHHTRQQWPDAGDQLR